LATSRLSQQIFWLIYLITRSSHLSLLALSLFVDETDGFGINKVALMVENE